MDTESFWLWRCTDMPPSTSIAFVFDGWGGYQTSLVHAVESLTSEQLAWRPVDHRRSVGELVRHISLGRITWFSRMSGPGLDQAVSGVPRWFTDRDGARHADERSVPLDNAEQAVEWLTLSWKPVRAALDEWSIADLSKTYRHRFQGRDYLISRQWTIWRTMAHDIQHGGQIAMMLAIQGIESLELGKLGGHIVEPPLAPGG
jgi:uncharacterized damage-inducible protein DinB